MIVLKWGLNALFILPKSKHFISFLCSAEDLFTLTSNKFRMVSKVDGNPSLIHVIEACTRTFLNDGAK